MFTKPNKLAHVERLLLAHFERELGVALILSYLLEEDKSFEQVVELQAQTDELDESIPKPPPDLLMPDEDRLVFKRHLVDPMPADGWNDVWKQLHKQISHVEIVQPRSLPMQMYPTFETAVVWGMRLILAATVYKVLDRWLYPIYKMKDPEDRPVRNRPKLRNNEFGELGALGQSR